MPDERIEDQLKDIIVERCGLKVSPQDLDDQDSLFDKWGLESVKILEMVVGMEDLFDVEFEDDEFTKENFETIARIAQVIRAKLS